MTTMRYAIVSLRDAAPAWVAAALPAGWRVAATLHDLAVLIEGEGDLPPNAHEIDATTAAILRLPRTNN